MPRSLTPIWKVFLFSLVAVVLLVAAAIVVATGGAPGESGLHFELRLHLIKFLLVAALGAVLAFLVESVKRREKQRDVVWQHRIDTMTSLLTRLDCLYRRVKHTRQQLGSRPGHSAHSSDEMWSLREEQEDLEQLSKDIGDHERTYADLRRVREDVEHMDSYLGKCWYEFKMADDASASFGERLKMFVESPKTGSSDFPGSAAGTTAQEEVSSSCSLLANRLLNGPAGAFKQKPTVSPCKKTVRRFLSLILISCMGFLVTFRPKMAF